MNDFHEIQAPNKESSLQRVALTVCGSVQGVFFRQSLQEWAISLGIVGFAHNRPDGCVYVEAEGQQEDLDSFIAWCRQGPPQAKVERVDINHMPPQKDSGFNIK